MNRQDLQALAEIRLREAKALLRERFYDGAFYLAGYAVECALKACIARQTKEHDFPDKTVVNQSYTHDLEKLVRTAGLQSRLDNEMKQNGNFAVNWATVKDWTEESRYRQQRPAAARDLLRAVGDRKAGVMAWLRQYW